MIQKKLSLNDDNSDSPNTTTVLINQTLTTSADIVVNGYNIKTDVSIEPSSTLLCGVKSAAAEALGTVRSSLA